MILGGIVGGYYGIRSNSGEGLSEAEVIALIEARDDDTERDDVTERVAT